MGDKPNRLIHEKSPYLLQHAFNPVDWYPWGDEAFTRAKLENKPIFLSVGYSTCHWCHVMEEESFENARIAALLNRWFICIKVDREERPDIDQMYMSATQAMTGSGGWPMSVFLFPDGRAFYAGTYFPPRSMYGRPGFGDLLQGIHEAWESRRPDLENVASELVTELEKQTRLSGADDKLQTDILHKAYQEFLKNFDRTDGGFSLAPKFPRPVQYNFLLRYWYRTGETQARDMVLQTLEHMKKGGILDQLGGGFHRYSTDTKWFVPHFEKMLYDQAQLANTYLDAFQITGDRRYADLAAGIFNYVLRDMTHPEGGFYSAEDADSEDPYQAGAKREGAYYLWTAQQIRETLAAVDADIFIYRFGVADTGNVSEDPHGEFKGRNILYQAHTIEETAEKLNMTVEQVSTSLHISEKTLLALRARRKRPHLDDKILVSWNGLMIGALARGAVVLEDANLLAAAKRSALFLRKHLYNEKKGKLNRRYRDGETGLEGQLDDYAFLVNGLVALYQAEQVPKWLQWTVELTRKQIELFWDPEQGGFFDSVADSSLPFRMKGTYDGAEPAANSIAAANLLLLGAITMNRDWLEKGAFCTEMFSSAIMAQPTMLPEMLSAWDLARSKPLQVIVVGPPGRGDTSDILCAVNHIYAPDRIILLLENGSNQEYLSDLLDFTQGLTMVNGKATAYVCKDFTCRIPTTSPREIRNQLVSKPSKTPLV